MKLVSIMLLSFLFVVTFALRFIDEQIALVLVREFQSAYEVNSFGYVC